MEQVTPNDITIFAKTNFRNKQVPFGIKRDDRRRHMYLIGKTGMGKSTMMENMVIQDIINGEGVGLVDPHGDLAVKVLDFVPSYRVNDVVYFNPADIDFPMAFNILETVDPRYKHLVASGLMGVFTKIWSNVWSARMEYIMNNCILALLDSPGNTLLGISRMLVDKKYRKRIVDNIKDPMVRSFWTDEFANWNEKYRSEAVAPIQNKVGQFLSTGIIRNIVGQPKSTIDIRKLMDEKKILVMNLSKGAVGEDNSALLGAMLITKIQLAALSRVDIPREEDRSDFYLYVDEFQNFATDSFATILSEARKYRLNLIMGHQYIGQLINDRNTKVRDAVFGNVGTIVTFRVGAADAEFMENEFTPLFEQNDLVNLPKYNVLLKLMINGVASDPFTGMTLPPEMYPRTDNMEKIIRISRERYANPLSIVEDKILRWMGQDFHDQVAVIAQHSTDADVEMEAEQLDEVTAKAREANEEMVRKEAEIAARESEMDEEFQTKELMQEAVHKAIEEEAEHPEESGREVAKHVEAEIEGREKAKIDNGHQQNSNQQQQQKSEKHDQPKQEEKKHDRHDDHRDRGGHDHGSHDKKKDQKGKNNPIWDKAAKMTEEKVAQKDDEFVKQINDTLQLLRSKQNQKGAKPFDPAKEESVVIQNQPQGEPAEPQGELQAEPSESRKVIKPGESIKFD